ncbi:MAG: peptidoglycan DD-metalloendopeptidase family protein [Lactobacillaceae bacterium]|jgi:septal ring factor EnvC (AmiA/AmiB activator)|nr:peptidoglycan DD-metalloendopeptidase family protein [Lactobacillaceae bacterium]
MNFNAAIKKITLSTWVLALTLNVAFAAVSNKDLEDMEKKVQQQALEHKKLQAQAIKINLEISSISREMVKRARRIQNQEEEASKMEAELKKLAEDLKKAEEDFIKQDENLIKTLSALQNLALKPTEALLVQPLTPVEVIRSAMLLRETIPTLEQSATRIKKDLEQIEKKKKLVETQMKKIGEQNKKLEKEQVQLKDLAKRKSKIKQAVEKRTLEAKKEMDKLASQASDIRDLLSKLEKERQTRLKKEEDERKRLAQEQKETGLKKTQAESIKEIEAAFVKAKGRLTMPARGAVIISYGQETAKGVTSKGITIQTRSYAQVTSIFDGTVIFAGPFRGYGNLIIIEHGEGYLSLLAGLETIDCELGQMLLAGEPVGQMGSDMDTNLYVEIRENNKPINPFSWIKR